MKHLLNLKSWQLFIILFCPIVFASIVTLTLPIAVNIVTSLWLIIYLIWLYITSANLYKTLSKGIQMKVHFTIIQIHTVITFICLLFIPISSHITISSVFNAVVFAYSFVGLIFSIFCCANILALKENNQNTIQNFLLLWFYPIGLWVIQPRIKAAFNKKDDGFSAFVN